MTNRFYFCDFAKKYGVLWVDTQFFTCVLEAEVVHLLIFRNHSDQFFMLETLGKRKAYGFLKWVTKEVESCMNLSGESKLRYIYVVTYLKCRCGYIYIFQRFEEMKGLGKCFDVSNDLHN